MRDADMDASRAAERDLIDNPPPNGVHGSSRAALPEKPLHVKVAEALGWTQLEFYPTRLGPCISDAERALNGGCWCGAPPGVDTPVGIWPMAPRYDTDWSATGPLIEKYGIWSQLSRNEEPHRYWSACVVDVDGKTVAIGPTLLVAVCNLILALGKAGKL